MTINRPKQILVVGPAWVGDMVMTHSLFQVLKLQNPAATIDVLAPTWSLGLLERMPEVSRVWISAFGHGELKLRARYQLGKQLRAERYDQVIFIPNSLKSALVPFFAHIPQRTGFYGEWPRRLWLNDGRALDKKRWPLMVQRFASLGLPADKSLPDPLPWPKLTTNSVKLAATLQKYELSPPQNRLLVMAPGAEFGPSKRWPTRYFAEVAKAKIQEGWEVWLLGSTKDQGISAELNAFTQQHCKDLTGKTSLTEAIDLLSLASTVVTNDSGLMHVAAALERRIIALYGPTPADVTPPLAHNAQSLFLDLPCRPCMKRECPLGHGECMVNLKPATVLTHMMG